MHDMYAPSYHSIGYDLRVYVVVDFLDIVCLFPVTSSAVR
jgi:hypothetical protein